MLGNSSKVIVAGVAILGLIGGFFFLKGKGVSSVDDLIQLASSGKDKTADESLDLPPIDRAGDTIRIASFNIQVFGESKSGKPHVMRMLTSICREFDVVAIQEIRAKDQGIIPNFVAMLNDGGRKYDYVIGPRLGRTSSKEQYAFVFDTASVVVDRTQMYTVDDPDDLLHREPLVTPFRVRGPQDELAFTFTLVNIHTDPDETDIELDALGDVYRAVANDGRREDDIIILGDLNVDDQHLGRLGEISGITVAVSNQPTNVRRTAQYDNIVFHGRATREYTGRGGVYDFLRKYNMTQDEALEVSDHLPVWAEFSIYEGGDGRQGDRIATRPGDSPQ
jgi:deoxyribonuclease-1-like protein